ncbi:MAG: UbiX family flavin prenyltransferase [Candidatus Diapherotrites archaeon]|nr:UbiX family flavin prenyltransferase [Candidatus Diapherotrites archaeon]MBT4597277.1 UbiX family flavin prenyltransferase [Candidatus Diapherotrites archaeon]
MKVIIGISGASGTNYTINFLTHLKKQKIETHVIVSEWAEKVFEKENNKKVLDIKKLATKTYTNKQMDALIASSSFLADGMIIIPASVKTCSEIATAHTGTLITRCADIMLRYKKSLVVCLRETPLSGPCLEQLTKIAQYGGIVMPLSPGFYGKPTEISDLEDFISGKVMDLIGIANNSYTRWKQ